MASAMSTQDVLHGHDRQPRLGGGAQFRDRSERRLRSDRVCPVSSSGRKVDRRAGPLHPGDAIRVFSRSAGGWLDGEVAEFTESGLVRVEYAIGDYLYGKNVQLHSEHLTLPTEVSWHRLATGLLAKTDVAMNLTCKGLSVRQLVAFCGEYQKQGKINATTLTRDVVREIIIPETGDAPSCYMASAFMKKHGGAKLARKFVSHWWGAAFLNTALNIILDASGLPMIEVKGTFVDESGGLNAARLLEKLCPEVLEKTYWLCIFAINEHRSICGDCLTCCPRSSAELAAPRCPDHPRGCGQRKQNPCRCGVTKYTPCDPEYEIVPTIVLGLLDGVVLSLDREMKTVGRVWCVAEVGTAIVTGKDISYAGEVVTDLLQSHSKFPSVLECEATDPKDKDRVLEQIESYIGVSRFDAEVSASLLFSVRNTALINAVYNARGTGNADRVRELLAYRADPNSRIDQTGFGSIDTTLLCEASAMGEAAVVKELIASGADVNRKNPNGWTPMVFVSLFVPDGKAVEVAKLLLEGRADANLLGHSYLECAFLNDKFGLIELLMDKTETESRMKALACCVQHDKLAIIELLGDATEELREFKALALAFGADREIFHRLIREGAAA